MAKPKFEISVQIPADLGSQFTKNEIAKLRKSFAADVALVLEVKQIDASVTAETNIPVKPSPALRKGGKTAAKAARKSRR